MALLGGLVELISAHGQQGGGGGAQSPLGGAGLQPRIQGQLLMTVAGHGAQL